MKSKTKIKILFVISLIISLLLIYDTYAKYQEQVYTNHGSTIKKWKMIVNDKIIREQESLNQVVLPTLEKNTFIGDNLIVPGREGYFDMEIDFSQVEVPFSVEFFLEQNETSSTYNKLVDFEFYGYYVEENDTFYYNLPEEYQQVEYIEITKNQYIDTNGIDESELKLVPCYRKSDNEIGMYDMFSGNFYTNAGTGKFSKGSDIEKVVIDPSLEKYKNDKTSNVKAYIKWVDGDGTTESPIDQLNNIEDTNYVLEEINNNIEYKATVIFEQYIEK